MRQGRPGATARRRATSRSSQRRRATRPDRAPPRAARARRPARAAPGRGRSSRPRVYRQRRRGVVERQSGDAPAPDEIDRLTRRGPDVPERTARDLRARRRRHRPDICSSPAGTGRPTSSRSRGRRRASTTTSACASAGASASGWTTARRFEIGPEHGLRHPGRSRRLGHRRRAVGDVRLRGHAGVRPDDRAGRPGPRDDPVHRRRRLDRDRGAARRHALATAHLDAQRALPVRDRPVSWPPDQDHRRRRHRPVRQLGAGRPLRGGMRSPSRASSGSGSGPRSTRARSSWRRAMSAAWPSMSASRDPGPGRRRRSLRLGHDARAARRLEPRLRGSRRARAQGHQRRAAGLRARRATERRPGRARSARLHDHQPDQDEQAQAADRPRGCPGRASRDRRPAPRARSAACRPCRSAGRATGSSSGRRPRTSRRSPRSGRSPSPTPTVAARTR